LTAPAGQGKIAVRIPMGRHPSRLKEDRVKFLLFLVILAAAAYFAPSPLAHVEQSIEIAASRDRVWTVVGDIGSARVWDPAMKDMKIVSDQKTDVGAVRTAPGALAKTTETAREWVTYNRIVFDVTHDPKITKFETSTITIEPGADSGTKVTWMIDDQMAGGYLGQFADKFLLGSIHEGRVADGLPRLKRFVETGESPI
jgi:hypothetical protein